MIGKRLVTEPDDFSEELKDLKFDLQQREEMLALKNETIKNLTTQLEQ